MYINLQDNRCPKVLFANVGLLELYMTGLLSLLCSEVLEGLDLRPGLSFLNVGSGTGYLSTLVGLILGSGGVSHGVEIFSSVVKYSTRHLYQFYENCATLDEFDFCPPKYFTGEYFLS